MNAPAAGEASVGAHSLNPREYNFMEQILWKTSFICSVAHELSIAVLSHQTIIKSLPLQLAKPNIS